MRVPQSHAVSDISSFLVKGGIGIVGNPNPE
jgi:hypothetical protein